MGSLGTSRRQWCKSRGLAVEPALPRGLSAPSLASPVGIALLSPSKAMAGLGGEELRSASDPLLPDDATPLVGGGAEVTPAYQDDTEESYLARLAYFSSLGRRKRPSSASSRKRSASREPASLMELFEAGRLGRGGCWLRRPSKQLEEGMRSRSGSTCSTRSQSPSIGCSLSSAEPNSPACSEGSPWSRRGSLAPSDEFTGPCQRPLSASPPVRDRFPSKSSTLKLPPLR